MRRCSCVHLMVRLLPSPQATALNSASSSCSSSPANSGAVCAGPTKSAIVLWTHQAIVQRHSSDAKSSRLKPPRCLTSPKRSGPPLLVSTTCSEECAAQARQALRPLHWLTTTSPWFTWHRKRKRACLSAMISVCANHLCTSATSARPSRSCRMVRNQLRKRHPSHSVRNSQSGMSDSRRARRRSPSAKRSCTSAKRLKSARAAMGMASPAPKASLSVASAAFWCCARPNQNSKGLNTPQGTLPAPSGSISRSSCLRSAFGPVAASLA
mmetsp:Transcript_32093/g.92227  ORF Transcript_32093/g.92227 Transcript_32093/m.92227 type:complete len:268 (+) Transcript_32093:314-1117(+)